MKNSNYNYILYSKGFSYWFNSLSFSYFRTSETTGRFLESKLHEHDNLEELPGAVYQKLFSGGFIIPDDIDELECIREANEKAVNSKDYFLVIMPTMDCNYKCWYCIQNHKPSLMGKETLEKLKKHILYMIHKEKISGLHIDWFGGEPLMYFKEIVLPFSMFAKEECDKAGIPFENGATTNAYYITDEIVKYFDLINFKQFQITLDGNKELHDRVKFIEGCPSAFERSLEAIRIILSNLGETTMFLRINYTHSNTTPEIVEQINRIIPPELRSRITVMPRRVWQVEVDKNFNIQPVMIEFLKSGYDVEKWNLSLNHMPCYTCKKYYNAINYNGQVVKCTATDEIHQDVFTNWLNDDGTIHYGDNYLDRYQAKSYENSRCLGCRILPICMGVCPRNFNFDKSGCIYDSIDGMIEDNIIDLIDRAYEGFE